MSGDTSKYIQDLDLSRLPAHAGPVLIAIGQFNDGMPITAACPSCNHLISVMTRGSPPSAWSHSCPCGTCNGSLRGL